MNARTKTHKVFGHLKFRYLLAVVAAVFMVAAAAACEPSEGDYVALGDSFTAGPGILPYEGSPTGCHRSTKNFAKVATPKIKVNQLRDISCSGATTNDLYNPQSVTGGSNQPQLNALKADTKVVTMSMGGNDIGFSGIIMTCVTANPLGESCTEKYNRGGVDELAGRIAATAPKIDRAIHDIRARSPKAKIFLVGYPAILPESGSCYTSVPILARDIPYLRDTHKRLNAMISQRAQTNGAYFVDTYTQSIGHDACKSSGVRWAEGLVPSNLAASFHPNANGMNAIGNMVATEINKVVKN